MLILIQVTFADETPRPYFLRGHPKFSSTPLLIPNNENKGNQLVGTNLEDRLHSLEEHKSLSDDSGEGSTYFSILNSKQNFQVSTHSPRPSLHLPAQVAAALTPVLLLQELWELCRKDARRGISRKTNPRKEKWTNRAASSTSPQVQARSLLRKRELCSSTNQGST